MQRAHPVELPEYESNAWEQLLLDWEREPRVRRLLPDSAKGALDRARTAANEGTAKAQKLVERVTPSKVQDSFEALHDAALKPTIDAALNLINLLNSWVSELTDPRLALKPHMTSNSDIGSVSDLRSFPLADLDAPTRTLPLKLRTAGVVEGGLIGSLALLPAPIVGSMAAISIDFIATQAINRTIATHICHCYGFDSREPQVQAMIDLMAAGNDKALQMSKAHGIGEAGKAFSAAKGRVRWSAKIRQDHRLLEALEKLLKNAGGAQHVSIQHARMGLPLVSTVIGAGINQQLFGATASRSLRYARTMFLAERYDLELPARMAPPLRPSSEEEPDDSDSE